MRADLGFLLIGLGLVGAYLVLGGKITTSNPSTKPTTSNGVANQLSAAEGNNISKGDVGLSPSALLRTQLGYGLALQPGDRRASKGGMQ